MGDCFIVRRGGGAGGLNFTVIGGTAEPTSPKENTIWVETDVKINGWSFSSDEPEYPVEGLVWIVTVSNSAFEFNALKKNGINVYPNSAKQYIAGVWEDKTAKSYQNGAWVEWLTEVILYDYGNECANVTGGWESLPLKYVANNQGTALNVEGIQGGVRLTQRGGGHGGIYKTKNKISLDNCRAVYFTGQIYKNANKIGLVILPEIGNTIEERAIAIYDAPEGTTDYEEQAILDISDVKGDCYIAFYINSSDGKYIDLKRLRIK